MWSWVTNAVTTATNWVKGAVNTVKKAADVIETVNSGAESAIQKVKSTNVSKAVSDWRDAYNQATDALVGNN